MEYISNTLYHLTRNNHVPSGINANHKLMQAHLDELITNGIQDTIVIKLLEYFATHEDVGQLQFQLGVLLLNEDPELSLQLFNNAHVLQDVIVDHEPNGAATNLKMRNELLLAGCNQYPDTRERVVAYLEKTSHGNSQQAIQTKYQLAMLLKESDPAKAIALFMKAADSGHGEAAFEYAENYFNDDHHPPIRDYIDRTINGFKEVETFGAFFTRCKDLTSALTRDVFTTPRDAVFNAFHYYEIAAKAGHKLAEFRCLERIALSSYSLSIPIPGTSFEMSLDATTVKGRGAPRSTSRMGINSQEAAFHVGMAYLYGDNEWGVLRDEGKAAKYLICAAEQRHFTAAYLASNLDSHEVYSPYFCGMAITGSLDAFSDADVQSRMLHAFAAIGGYEPAILEEKMRGEDKDAAKDAALKLYRLHRYGDASLHFPSNTQKAFTCLLAAFDGNEVEAKIQWLNASSASATSQLLLLLKSANQTIYLQRENGD